MKSYEELDMLDDDWEDDENYDSDHDNIENYLYTFSEDDLIDLAKKLNVKCNNLEDLSEDNLVTEIICSIDEDIIKDTCESLLGYSFQDYIADNAWRYSDYESKDIGDWDVDDHLAAWYDHMMEK
jgi:hypothetical protein